MLETNMGKLARQACEEEITLLRNRSEFILESLDSLEEEKLARKQHHYKVENSVLRSFQWKEKEIDPVILEGALGSDGGKRLHRNKYSYVERDAKVNFESHH